MTDPHMNRTDWMNEAADSPKWQADTDTAYMQQASDLCHALIDIGQAISRSELDTTARKLREMWCYDDTHAAVLARVVDVVDDYRARFLNAWAIGGFSVWREGLHEELEMALEDVDALARDDR